MNFKRAAMGIAATAALFITASPAALEPNSGPAVQTYRLDPARSSFVIEVFSGGLLGAFGHDHKIGIRDFRGEARVTPGSIEPAGLDLIIRANSLTVLDDVSAGDKAEIERTMREEVLETARFPEVVFKGASVSVRASGQNQYSLKIAGDLSLHGVTRKKTVDASMTISGNTLRGRGSFNVKHGDFNLKRVSVAAGTVRVRDEIKLTFDIVAIKQ